MNTILAAEAKMLKLTIWMSRANRAAERKMNGLLIIKWGERQP